MGEAILEFGHQYSVEESRHIIATSLPCHFHVIWVNEPTLEAQEWHFCNSEWQSGSFVNMSGRGDDHEIRSAWRRPAAPSSSPLSQTSIFVVFKLWKVTHGGTNDFFTFFTFYESWTTHWSCINVFYRLGNIYIEAFSILVAVFRCCPFLFLLIFDSCTNLGFLHQFALIWMVESKFMFKPYSDSMRN